MASPSRRLDLAVILPTLEKYGGAERLVIECVRRWQARHRITLYATLINEDLLAEHGVDAQVERRLLSPRYEGEHAMLLNAVLLPHLWRNEIGQHEIYHAHGWPTHLIDRHPMVWYPHEPLRMLHDLRFEQKYDGGAQDQAHIYPKYDYERFQDALFEPYLRAIQASDESAVPETLVANSWYTAGYLERVYGRKVTDVVYPGAELTTPLELPKDPNLFVTVSQLWRHKRVHLLIEALALTDGTQLMVIGSGPEREWLGALAERLGVSDRVFFLSGLRNVELELILARACAFLFSPIREPFGIVVLEAMAAGLPVIAADEGGYAEVCSPDTAFLVPPHPSAFAEKMMELQADAQLRARMGEAGRRAAATHTWTRTAEELETILLREAPPHKDAAGAQDGRRTLVGVQYYLWYGEGFGAAHWNDNAAFGYVADKPLLGFYGSATGGTIEAHLDQFEAMGLDYAVLNLHVDENGRNGIEWRSIDHVFRIAEARGSPLRFAIQIAPYTGSAEILAETLAFLRRECFGRSNYLSVGGQPALFWFWSGAHDRKGDLLEQLSSATSGLTNIATGLRLPVGAGERELTGGLFRGFVPFSPLELSDDAGRENVWNMGYSLAADAGMTLRVASVSPGYDDTALADARRFGNPRRTVPREGGEIFARSLRWVETLSPPPDLVIVSTFNEFHENTHIEPTLRTGSQYVDLTRDFVARLRAREAGQQ